jgi:hypothetical protein
LGCPGFKQNIKINIPSSQILCGTNFIYPNPLQFNVSFYSVLYFLNVYFQNYVPDLWVKKIESYHDIFLEREKYKSDESKRPEGCISNSELLGFEGSFRKLEID